MDGEPDTTPRAERELPVPPAVVSERLGQFEEILTRYAGWLVGAGTVRGLMGPRETDRIWDRHLLNCAVVGELLPQDCRVVDIGSGAGLPGIAIACLRPDVQVDLVESLLRRTDFLSEVIDDLGLNDRVRVVRGRAEDTQVVDTVGSSEFVTARAVAPLDKLVRWSFPLLRAGGSLLAMKGSSAEDEIAEHRGALRRMRAEVVGIRDCGSGIVEPLTRVVEVRRTY